MILGCLGGLIFGCFIAITKYWDWRALAPMLRLNDDPYPPIDSVLIVLVSAILGILLGAVAGW